MWVYDGLDDGITSATRVRARASDFAFSHMDCAMCARTYVVFRDVVLPDGLIVCRVLCVSTQVGGLARKVVHVN